MHSWKPQRATADRGTDVVRKMKLPTETVVAASVMSRFHIREVLRSRHRRGKKYTIFLILSNYISISFFFTCGIQIIYKNYKYKMETTRVTALTESPTYDLRNIKP